MLEEVDYPGWEGEAVVVALVLVETSVKLGRMLSGTRVVAIANGRVAFLQTQLRVESVRTTELDDSLAVEEMLVRDEVTQNLLEAAK